MKVGLFVPCFIDAFFPGVAVATVQLLERLGCEVHYPLDQTCCGQPLANSGCNDEARGTEELFVRNFAGFDTIVAPGGSCVHHVRHHLLGGTTDASARHVRDATLDLVEFLHDRLQVREFPWAEFPHAVGLHVGCSSLRHLGVASSSELAHSAAEPFSKPRTLLAGVKGLRLVQPQRPDECCGFGGTFSVHEEPVSARMGQDKVADHLQAGAEVIVSGDMSCLMHQQGCAQRQGLPLRFMHIAQVLNGEPL